MQARALAALSSVPRTAEELASEAGEDDVETLYLLLEHLAANGRARREGVGPTESRFARTSGGG